LQEVVAQFILLPPKALLRHLSDCSPERMRVKHLVTTRMVGNKRGASKGKEKECKAATTTEDRWKPSKCSKAYLQSKDVIQWRPAIGNKRPYEGVDEIVLFQ
jgi:hypothetical protein